MEKAKGKETGCSEPTRDWGQMDLNILISIFQKLQISDLLPSVAHVCSEWRRAVSHTHYFVVQNKLNLRPYDMLTFKEQPIYVNLLKKSLERETNLNDLQFFHDIMLPDDAVLYIAQRSSNSLRSLYLTEYALIHFSKSLLPKILSYWENLTSFVAVARDQASPLECINVLGLHCKKLTHLGLFGSIGNQEAEAIVASFPELQSLDFRSCFFPESALSIIMDGAKKLKSIDITHAICWEAGTAKDLTQEFLDRAAALEDFQYCGGERCWLCGATFFIGGNFEMLF